MPRFNYTAIDQNKKTVKGTVTAESSYAARKHLRNKGLHPTNIKEVKGAAGGKRITLFKKRNVSQVAEFTKQLSTMLGAEIKLTEALSVLIQQVSDANLKSTVTDIRDRVVSGESFADALGDHSEYFDVIYVSMMRIGEVTGTLPNSLLTIANFMEKRQRVESKMVTVMIYPMILLTVCLFAVIFLTIKVIPVIAEQIQKTGQEIPGITKFLLNVSSALTSWWIFVIIGAIGLTIFVLKKFFTTEKGAYIKDKTLLSLPVFGPLLKQRIVARFASTLSTLLGSGLSVAESLKVVADVTGNSIMTKAVKKARDRILSGADIATPLKESGVIDPAVAHMVSVGEKSGELEKMLKSISDNLDSSSDIVIERLSSAIEPVIIVVMAILVGIIAYATLLPIIKFSAGQP
ncbi:MAG: type II secretion system F family protein [Planctomycetes bacterium]|nr:type II secretion system F family protein [Planctomycetota bacterium]